MRITNRFALLLSFWLLLVLGCGGSSKTAVARLSGSIKYKGTPVTGGMITLIAKGEDGNAAGNYLASIDPDGTYSTSQLPAGEFIVGIETESVNPNRQNKQYGEKEKRMKNSASPRPDYAKEKDTAKGNYVKIPGKYNNPEKSGLTVTLTSGKNVKDFDLTD